MTKAYNHFIGGAMVTGKSGSYKNIFNPSLGDVSGTVVLANPEEVDLAVKSAQKAFPGCATVAGAPTHAGQSSQTKQAPRWPDGYVTVPISLGSPLGEPF